MHRLIYLPFPLFLPWSWEMWVRSKEMGNVGEIKEMGNVGEIKKSICNTWSSSMYTISCIVIKSISLCICFVGLLHSPRIPCSALWKVWNHLRVEAVCREGVEKKSWENSFTIRAPPSNDGELFLQGAPGTESSMSSFLQVGSTPTSLISFFQSSQPSLLS